VTERLTDEQVAKLTERSYASRWSMPLAVEVQQWRALIPDVIEQLEVVRAGLLPEDYYEELDTILAKLREAIGP